MNRRAFLGAALAVALAPRIALGRKRPTRVHGIPLPPGTRSLEDNLFQSSRGFRKTVDFYKKFLRRQGLIHDEKRVYRYRGVVIARFISRERSAKWRAIHVFKSAGRTRIYIVPQTGLTAPAGDGNETDSRT